MSSKKTVELVLRGKCEHSAVQILVELGAFGQSAACAVCGPYKLSKYERTTLECWRPGINSNPKKGDRFKYFTTSFFDNPAAAWKMAKEWAASVRAGEDKVRMANNRRHQSKDELAVPVVKHVTRSRLKKVKS